MAVKKISNQAARDRAKNLKDIINTLIDTNGVIKPIAIVGDTIQMGTAHFDNTKTLSITFAKSFNKKPMITLTPGDSGNFPIYSTSVTLTGFKIRCKMKWTGETDWVATERNT